MGYKPEPVIWLVTDEADIRACGILLRRSCLHDDLEIKCSSKTSHPSLGHLRTVREARTKVGHGSLHTHLLKGRLELVGLECKAQRDQYSRWKREMERACDITEA